MNSIDDTIRQALQAEDQEWFDSLGEQGPINQVIDSFRTRNRWLMVISVVFMFGMMGGAVYTGIGMFHAPDAREAVWWAMGLFFCVQAITALKIWFWMEMGRNATTREIKRMELQVARLAARLGKA